VIDQKGFFQNLLKRARENLGVKLQDINYKYLKYAHKKKFKDITFRSYGFFSSSDILLSELYTRSSKDEVIYDIGAYQGSYTLTLAAKGCFIYAFEPNPNSFNKLQTNVNINEFKNVKTYNIGLSDSKNFLQFYISSNAGRSSFHQYNAIYDGNKIVDTKLIEVETIDNLVKEKKINLPRHIKIDVEGHELEVLRGGEETIANYKPIIYLEPHEMNDGKNREEEINQFFQGIGYKIIKHGYPWICMPISQT
jgi:FkbM family methyltransferase